jgi:hypothetical protein
MLSQVRSGIYMLVKVRLGELVKERLGHISSG